MPDLVATALKTKRVTLVRLHTVLKCLAAVAPTNSSSIEDDLDDIAYDENDPKQLTDTLLDGLRTLQHQRNASALASEEASYCAVVETTLATASCIGQHPRDISQVILYLNDSRRPACKVSLSHQELRAMLAEHGLNAGTGDGSKGNDGEEDAKSEQGRCMWIT